MSHNAANESLNRAEKSQSLGGILNLNKPAGMTSHDVVNQIRRITGERRVGHAGALDPMATGVLVVCLGWATRLTEYLMEGKKCYRAIVRLGVTTATYDAEGVVVGRAERLDVTRAQVETALGDFVGEIEQVPPVYSALKQGGIPLYKLARRGASVEPLPRRVTVYKLTLAGWQPPDVVLEIECSRGTYIRSLAHDLGQRLGCGAHLAALTRTASGPFVLEQAITLEQLAASFARSHGVRLFYPLERALPDFVMLRLDAAREWRVRKGQAIDGPQPSFGRGLALAIAADGEPLAVLQYQVEAGKWCPAKVFVT